MRRTQNRLYVWVTLEEKNKNKNRKVPTNIPFRKKQSPYHPSSKHPHPHPAPQSSFERCSAAVDVCQRQKPVRLAESCDLSLRELRHLGQQPPSLNLSIQRKERGCKMGLCACVLMTTDQHPYRMPEDVARPHSRACGNGRPRTGGLDAPRTLSTRSHLRQLVSPPCPLLSHCLP